MKVSTTRRKAGSLKALLVVFTVGGFTFVFASCLSLLNFVSYSNEQETTSQKWRNSALSELNKCSKEVKGSGPVLVIVPYRKREEHLSRFLPHMLWHLRNQLFTLIIVNDTGKSRFNRGALLNIGFLVGKETHPESSWIILHDVDHLPPTELCFIEPPNNTLIAHKCGWYSTFVGGIASLKSDDFLRIDGFSNRFIGWGSEDDFLYLRAIDTNKMKFERTPQPNCLRFEHLANSHKREIGEHRSDLMSAARSDGKLSKSWFLGDGLTRFSREPKVIWTITKKYNNKVVIVNVNLDSFAPCANGEILPRVRPCLAQPPLNLQERENGTFSDAYEPDPPFDFDRFNRNAYDEINGLRHKEMGEENYKQRKEH